MLKNKFKNPIINDTCLISIGFSKQKKTFVISEFSSPRRVIVTTPHIKLKL